MKRSETECRARRYRRCGCGDTREGYARSDADLRVLQDRANENRLDEDERPDWRKKPNDTDNNRKKH